MTDRKFYKKTITLEVLSQEPIPKSMDIGQIAFEATEGDYSMRVLSSTDTVINGKDAANALLKQASDPSFFFMDKDGNDASL